MKQGGVFSDRVAAERRHASRVKLATSIRINRRSDEAEGGAVSTSDETARVVDLSAGGVYVAVQRPVRFVPDEILSVSLTVPSAAHRAVPFSKLAGLCRVVRVDERVVDGVSVQGMALAFCREHVTMLGTSM